MDVCACAQSHVLQMLCMCTCVCSECMHPLALHACIFAAVCRMCRMCAFFMTACAHACLKTGTNVCSVCVHVCARKKKIFSLLSLLAAVRRQSQGAESHYRTSQLPPTRSDAVHSLSHTCLTMRVLVCVCARVQDREEGSHACHLIHML